MKQYLYSGLLAALLYPLAWWFFRGQDSALLVFGDMYFAAFLTIGIIAAAMAALYVMRGVAVRVPEVWRNLVVRFAGAEVSALISAAEIYMLIVLLTGAYPPLSLDWVLAIQMPGFFATWIAYWIVSLLIKPVAPVPARVPTSNKKDRRR